jgi:hypothetical protein
MKAGVTISEPKSIDGRNVRKVRKRRKVVGELKFLSPHKDKVPRNMAVLDLKVPTEAWREEVQSWRVDADVVQEAKLYGLTHVRLIVEDGRELITMAGNFHPDHARIVSTRPPEPWMAAERRWLVPVECWVVTKMPPVEVREVRLVDRMKIGGRE